MAFAGMSEDELHRRAADFALGLLASLRQKAGKPLWVEKSPNDMFHVPVIARLCGDRVRYVWLVRHPLDVVCSLKELLDAMGAYPPDLHEYIRRFPAPLEAFGHAWVDTNRDLLWQRGEETILNQQSGGVCAPNSHSTEPSAAMMATLLPW
jgi:hypothetical protein